MAERGDDLEKFAKIIRDEAKPESEIMKLRLRKDQLLKIYRMTRPVESTARARIGKLLMELKVPKSDIPFIKLGTPLSDRTSYDLLADLKCCTNPSIVQKISSILQARGVRDPVIDVISEIDEKEIKKKTIRELKDICRTPGLSHRLQRKIARQELLDRGLRSNEIPSTPVSRERNGPDGRLPRGGDDRNNRFDRNGGRFNSPPRSSNAFIQGLAFAQILPNQNQNPNVFPGQRMGPGPFGGMGPFGPMPQGPPNFPPALMPPGPSIREIQQRELENRNRGRDEPRRDRSPFRDQDRNRNERRGDDNRRFDDRKREEPRGNFSGGQFPLGDRPIFNERERGRSDNLGGRGRERSRSPVRFQQQPPRPQKDVRKIRVMKASSMPFSERDVAYFGELLFDIIKGTVGRAPLIEDTERKGSGLIISCADDYSQQWLLQFVPRLQLDNEPLRAIVENDNPAFELLFPGTNKPVKELFLMLEKFNDWVDTSRWNVIESRNHENGLLLTIKAPPEWFSYFKKADWKLFFGLLPVRVFPVVTQ